MSTFFESPFVYEVPANLVGPDSSGGFYGAARDVPTDGTWEVQVQAGSGDWIRTQAFLEPKRWVRARPVPPEPLPVGTEVVVHGSYTATILAADGLWYWVRRDGLDRYGNPCHSTVPHRDVSLAHKPTPEGS